MSGSVTVKPDEKEIRSLPNLMDTLRHLRTENPKCELWFRGLADSKYELKPTSGRSYRFGDTELNLTKEHEEELLHQFRSQAYQHVGRNLNRWEAIMLARHHGLPVRLLDWARIPTAALYFACEHCSTARLADGKIWVLVLDRRAPMINPLNAEDGPLHMTGVRLVRPTHISGRITAQTSVFTIQDRPCKPLDQILRLEETEAPGIRAILGFTVPVEKKPVMLRYLADVGVTRGTIFPDLDGLCQGLVNGMVLRQGENKREIPEVEEDKKEAGKFRLYSDRERQYRKRRKDEFTPKIDIEISATRHGSDHDATEHLRPKTKGGAEQAICVGGEYLTTSTEDVQKIKDKEFQFAYLISHEPTDRIVPVPVEE